MQAGLGAGADHDQPNISDGNTQDGSVLPNTHYVQCVYICETTSASFLIFVLQLGIDFLLCLDLRALQILLDNLKTCSG